MGAYRRSLERSSQCLVQLAPAGLAITPSDRCIEPMAHPVHSEQKSVSMTRSTKTTFRIEVNFEIVLLTWEPSYGIEANRRPSPYHGHASPPTVHCLH